MDSHPLLEILLYMYIILAIWQKAIDNRKKRRNILHVSHKKRACRNAQIKSSNLMRNDESFIWSNIHKVITNILIEKIE